MAKVKYLNVNSSLSVNVPLDQVIFYDAGEVVDVSKYTLEELEEALASGDVDFDWMQAYQAEGSIVDYDYFDHTVVEEVEED